MEEEVVMLEEVQVLPEPADPAEPEDLGYMLACGDRNIFDEDASLLYTASQLVRDLSSPTQEDPGVPAHSQGVAEIPRDIPKPENFDWVAEMDAHNTEEQDNGQMDPCLPSQSVELPQGQGSSRQKFEPWSFQSEPTEQRIQEFVQEAQHIASLQDTSVAISGHSSKPQEVSNH